MGLMIQWRVCGVIILCLIKTIRNGDRDAVVGCQYAESGWNLREV